MRKPKVPTKQTSTNSLVMSVLPLRDVVVYPYMVIPLFVGRRRSVLALEAAMEMVSRFF